MFTNTIHDQVQVKSGAITGEFHFPVRLELSGDIVKYLDVMMTVIESKIEIISSGDGSVLNVAKFQPLYYGQRASLRAYLVNSSPFNCSFSITRTRTDENDFDDTDEVDNFSILPVEGHLPPHSRTPIRLFFHPKFQAKDVGFKSTVSEEREECFSEMVVETVETEQKLTLGMSGVALNLNVDISEREIRFGNCPVHSHQDVVVSIRNHQPNPVDFTIERIAHFYASPAVGVLSPHSSTEIVVTFAPNQMGTFKNRLVVLVAGLKRLCINLFGSSDSISQKTKVMGGITKIPEDFEREKNFIQTKRASEIGNLERAKELSEKHEKKLKYIGQDTDTEAYVNKLELLKQRRENERRYNTFIKTMREERLGKQQFELETTKIVNLMNDVDLGMEPGSGMESPKLAPILTEDELFVANLTDREEGGSLVRVSMNVLTIPKKWKQKSI